jgi:hypothetical protein
VIPALQAFEIILTALFNVSAATPGACAVPFVAHSVVGLPLYLLEVLSKFDPLVFTGPVLFNAHN